MKKLLALVLALVMVMGLSVVSANAATFSDADSIKYKEAVDVMSAIGVIDGMDGKFNPTGTLTREQGAKIISYMLLGKTGGDSLSAAVAPFDDVAANRWSAGAIAYCKSVGILGGVGDNKFNPEGELTGAAFSKMLLTALGYDATNEGLGGSDWSLNVARLVNRIDLANGLGSLTYSAAITRDEAAKLAFNTLSETMVEYLGAMTVKTSDGTVVNTATNATNVANTAYDYRSNGAAAAVALAGGTMQFCENYFPNLKMEVTKDSFGVPVNKWFTGGSRTDYIRSAAKTIVSVDADDLIASYTAATTPKKIRDAIGASSADVLTAQGAALAAGDTDKAVVYIDGQVLATFGGATAKTVYIGTGTGDIATTDNGVLTRVYRNSETRNVSIIISGVYLAKAVADYNTADSKIAVTVYNNGTGYQGGSAGAWPTEIKTEDISGLEGYKKDDYMLVTGTTDGTNWKIRTVTPANVISSTTLNGFRNNTALGTPNGRLVAGGVDYKYNIAFGNASTLGNALGAGGLTINDGTYNLYLDENNYVLGIKEVDASYKAEDFLFVRGVNVTTNFETKANVTFMDGTKATINVTKLTENSGAYYNVDGTGGATGPITAGGTWTTRAPGNLTTNGFYAYTKKSSGYELTVPQRYDDNSSATTVTAPTAGNYGQGVTSGYLLSGAIAPIYYDSNTTGAGGGTAIALNANNKTVTLADGKVYTGVSNLPKVGSDTAANATIYYVADENANIVAIYTTTKGTNTNDKTQYAFLWQAPYTAEKENGDTYYVFGAIQDGAIVDGGLKINTAGVAQGLYDISTADADGYIDPTGATTTTGFAAGDGDLLDAVQIVTNSASGGDMEVTNGTLAVNTGAAKTAIAVVNDSTRYFQIDARAGKDVNVKEISDGTVLTLDTTTATAATWTVYCLKDTSSAKTVSTVYIVRTV